MVIINDAKIAFEVRFTVFISAPIRVLIDPLRGR